MTTVDVQRILTREGDACSLKSVLWRDAEAGIARASMVVTLGTGLPGLGGTRLSAWDSDGDMLEENTRLSRGMQSKSLFHNLPFEGGKACVQILDGADREAVFTSVGRQVAALMGQILTTEDMNTTPADMAVMHREAPGLILGRPLGDGGSGDPSPFTAAGVFESLLVVAAYLGFVDLTELVVRIKGIGNVGSRVVTALNAQGVRLQLEDNDPERLAPFEGSDNVEIVDAVTPIEADIFCPCAGGGDIGPEFSGRVRAIVGAANNQLTSEADVAPMLAARGILYIPDWVANGGGLISVGAEHFGWSSDWARTRAVEIGDRVGDLIDRAVQNATTPLEEALAVCDRHYAERVASSRGDA